MQGGWKSRGELYIFHHHQRRICHLRLFSLSHLFSSLHNQSLLLSTSSESKHPFSFQHKLSLSLSLSVLCFGFPLIMGRPPSNGGPAFRFTQPEVFIENFKFVCFSHVFLLFFSCVYLLGVSFYAKVLILCWIKSSKGLSFISPSFWCSKFCHWILWHSIFLCMCGIWFLTGGYFVCVGVINQWWMMKIHAPS